MKVPATPLGMMTKIYRKVLPSVHEELGKWKQMASAIPDEELRRQALASIESKTFHCEGGSIYSLIAQDHYKDVIRFIVAYQTISDYLDNLCDRSVSLDPEDFRALHDAMLHALTPGAKLENYYRYRDVTSDGGYLEALVETCQSFLATLPSLPVIQPALHELAGFYCDLQVHKHVKQDQRVPRLQEWFRNHQDKLPEMSWYEFSACSGSTLGIFCIASYAATRRDMGQLVAVLKDGYFPWVQGLHILLDYFIDQEEDREGGDLNFCFYYDNDDMMISRFNHFIEQADESISTLPDKSFHKMINRGLLGIYLADKKVASQAHVRALSRKIMKRAGGSGMFFFINGWLYRRLKPGL
ncbi:tetraprenyl-beta-curcumene synthase [Scopulibacillus darangshiensis]|uniref:Tetraprenyl-beta-curcumene synthase n=1 Tax=Scopulibacillus darangshiensis TaxID=442528 RepID=A0A4R2NYP1_9BACL|nr:tetraprenyl-beta-curcumene synthase [Scopulibacillus darangshiensis]